MRTLAALTVLTLATACADAGIVQPEPESMDTPVSFDRAMDMPGAMEFFSTFTFVAERDPGVVHITPSGVRHRTGLVHEWAMVGDLTGPVFFEGNVNVNPSTGKGVAIGKPLWFNVQISKWEMTGTFACNNLGMLENYPAPDFTMHGHLSGCKGTGDFEGMNLWASFSNEDSPGLPYPGSPAGSTIAVAGNSDALFDPDGVEMAVAAVLSGLESEEPAETTAGDGARFAGVYDAGEVRFAVEAARPDSLRLTMSLSDAPGAAYFSTALVRIGANEYAGADSPEAIRVEFEASRGPAGATNARIFAVGISWDARRIE